MSRWPSICALLLALAAHILPAQLLAVVKTSRFGAPLTDIGMRIVEPGGNHMFHTDLCMLQRHSAPHSGFK